MNLFKLVHYLRKVVGQFGSRFASLAIHYRHYDYCRIHKSLRTSPAMAGPPWFELTRISPIDWLLLPTRPGGAA